MRATGWLWALPLVASFALAASGCEVSTCTGDDCDFDSPFDEDSGAGNGGNNGDDDGGGSGDEDGGASDGGMSGDGGGPDVDVGQEIDLDGDGTPDGEAIDTDDDDEVDGVDVDGDGEVDVPVPPASAPSLADFCDATLDARRAWAEKISACCANASSAESGSMEAEAILSLFGREDGAEGCLNAYKTFVQTGKLAFDGTKAKACAEEYTGKYPDPPSTCPGDEGFQYWDLLGKVGKGVPVFAQMDTCRAALRGRLSKGSECTSHFECAGELRCLKMSETRSTCQDAIANGGECASTAECDADLICAGTTGAGQAGRSCIPSTDLKLNGGGCMNSVECASGLYCEASSCVNVPEGVDLTATGDACTDAFACVGWCDASAMKCAPLCAQ